MGIAFYGPKGDKGLSGPPGPPGRYQEIVGPEPAVNTTGPPGTYHLLPPKVNSLLEIISLTNTSKFLMA